jgi:hypothetical protein
MASKAWPSGPESIEYANNKEKLLAVYHHSSLRETRILKKKIPSAPPNTPWINKGNTLDVTREPPKVTRKLSFFQS